MSGFPRYAIYYAPDPKSPFAHFGATMLGYDAWGGRDIAHPRDVLDRQSDWHDLTRDPRVYGFHATLKAPFALAAETTEVGLLTACARFADIAHDIPVIAPAVRAISGFIAVVPATLSPDLATLAQDCVETFESYRAPLTPADRARRKPETLSARQVAQLDHWGYPYVLDDFRFHMTLTGRLPPARQPEMLAMLQQHFSALGLNTLVIDRIALFRQDTDSSRFRVVADFVLSS